MHRIRRITAIILTVLTLSGACLFGTVTSASAGCTGAGLAEWALNAYYSGWEYVYGGCTPGTVDCSGLIYSYCGGARVGDAQLNTATESGSVSNGIPNVHGLGLYRPGHVGVYVGDGMEVDARGDAYDMCYESVYGSYSGWSYWFKLSACSYVTNGWEKFNGDYYYYENGEYITDTSRTIDGTTYYFDSKGRSSETPSDTSSSSSSSSSSKPSSDKKEEKEEPKKPASYRNGSSGDEVTKIQERLTELGFYKGEINGYFGDETEAAYRAFQEAAGILVDGISGSDREVLYSDDAPYAPVEETQPEETTAPVEEETEAETEAEEESNVYKNGDENEAVTEIQAQLAALLYFDLDPTGYYGDYTAQSVMNFQLANNLVVTGEVDEETYALLFSGDAIENPNPTVVEETTAPTQPVLEIIPAEFSATKEQNKTYTDNAVAVVKKTNRIAKKVLSNSSPVITSATPAVVKRTANVGLWFVLVATILSVLGFVFFLRDKKAGKYSKYSEKKRRRTAKVDIDTRW